MFSSPAFRRGLRDGSVVLVPVGAFGVAFGVLAVEAGLAAWVAVLASAIVVSGAAQFALVGLLASGPVPVLVATTGLALRHIPMSATLSELVGKQTLRTRLALAWVLVDETFGFTVNAARRWEVDVVSYKAAADMLLYSVWVGGTVAGATIGGAIDPAAWGADAFFAILFLGLAAPLVNSWRDGAVAVAAGTAAVAAAALLPPSWSVTVAAAAAALAASAVDRG